MEGGGSRNQLTTPSLMPVSAHSADNRILDLQLKQIYESDYLEVVYLRQKSYLEVLYLQQISNLEVL